MRFISSKVVLGFKGIKNKRLREKRKQSLSEQTDEERYMVGGISLIF